MNKLKKKYNIEFKREKQEIIEIMYEKNKSKVLKGAKTLFNSYDIQNKGFNYKDLGAYSYARMEIGKFLINNDTRLFKDNNKIYNIKKDSIMEKEINKELIKKYIKLLRNNGLLSYSLYSETIGIFISKLDIIKYLITDKYSEIFNFIAIISILIIIIRFLFYILSTILK
ncbi:hypothetical protein ACV3OB_16280 [Clostridium perfringens]